MSWDTVVRLYHLAFFSRMPHHGILESLIIVAVMKIVLVCTRRDQYGMIFHALVIEFIQFVNLYQISLFHLLSRQSLEISM